MRQSRTKVATGGYVSGRPSRSVSTILAAQIWCYVLGPYTLPVIQCCWRCHAVWVDFTDGEKKLKDFPGEMFLSCLYFWALLEGETAAVEVQGRGLVW
jgi:hypothetical protein